MGLTPQEINAIAVRDLSGDELMKGTAGMLLDEAFRGKQLTSREERAAATLESTERRHGETLASRERIRKEVIGAQTARDKATAEHRKTQLANQAKTETRLTKMAETQQKLIEQQTKLTGKRAADIQGRLDSMVDIYIGAQIERLLSTRNAWLPYSGKRTPYAGPQLQLYSKMFGARLVTDMARVLGPYTLTDDTEWGMDGGIFEVTQRSGVCFAPAGTPEALKIIISRALRIGR